MKNIYKDIRNFGVALVATATFVSGASAQFTEGFEGGATIPTGWTAINNNGDTQEWEFGAPPSGSANAGTNVAFIETNTSEAHDDYLITPAITVTANTNDVLNFFAKNNSATAQDEFNVLVSTSGTAVADFSDVIDASLAPADQWTEYTYYLTQYVGQTIYIAFQAVSQNEDALYLDDVAIQGLSTCLDPTELGVSNLTSTSGDLEWTENGYATTWNVEYDTAGFVLGNGNQELGVTASTHSINGLTENTDYAFYVQADCGGDESAWVGPFSFTTNCDPSTGTDTRTECSPFTWIDGNTYTSANTTATHTLINQAGCDSIVTLDLTIDGTVDNTTDTRTECAPFTWIDGNTYTSDENSATFTLTNQAGCDSIVTLDLTIDGAKDNTTDTRTECSPFTWIDGNTYTSDENSATFTLTNQAGCDSIITLNLVVEDPFDAGDDNSLTLCMNEPFDLASLLSSGAQSGGVWLNPMDSPLPSSEVVSSNFPGVYDYSYLIEGETCPSDTAVMTVTVRDDCDYVSTSEESMENVSVYPNPASTVLTIENPSNTADLKVELVDMNGRIVMNENKALNNTSETTLSIDYLENGIYTLRVYNNEGQKTFKVVKQ